MGRIARTENQAKYYHVMTQGVRGRSIFETDEDKGEICQIIEKVRAQKAVKILAYCVMNNHLHLLLNVPDVPCMAGFMKQMNIRYAKYYNLKGVRSGYVFRDRYRSQPVETLEQLRHCIRDIHNNPLVANYATNLWDYRWSSYFETVEGNQRIVDIAHLQGLFRAEGVYEGNFVEGGQVFSFMEDREEGRGDVLGISMRLRFLEDRGIDLNDVMQDRQLFWEYIEFLKREVRMSQRQIADWLSIGRETLRKRVHATQTLTNV